jgi:hypothetical protein
MNPVPLLASIEMLEIGCQKARSGNHTGEQYVTWLSSAAFRSRILPNFNMSDVGFFDVAGRIPPGEN